MDSLGLVALIFGAFFVIFLFSGWLIAFSIAASSMLAYLLICGGSTITNFALLGYNAMTNYNFLALPLFILMGELMIQGGIARKLYNSVVPLAGRVRGGLIYVNVLANTIFGACCGSTVAATSAISAVAIPEVTKRGYSKGISYGSLAAAGNLAGLIPPSVGLIVYSAISNTSLSELFVAGIVPGLILAGTLMLVTTIWIKFDSKVVPPRLENPLRLAKAVPFAICRLWSVALMIGAVLGSIYTGFATPTEAGTYGVVGAFILGIAGKELNLEKFKITLVDTIRAAVPILFIIAMAAIYGFALSYLGLKSYLLELLQGFSGPAWLQMFFIWLMLLVLGMFLDGGSIFILTTPIFLPFAMSLGYHPVWYGVWLEMAVDLGNITPPVGVTLYAVQSISRDKLEIIARGALPFWISFAMSQALLTLFPRAAMLLIEISS